MVKDGTSDGLQTVLNHWQSLPNPIEPHFSVFHWHWSFAHWGDLMVDHSGTVQSWCSWGPATVLCICTHLGIPSIDCHGTVPLEPIPEVSLVFQGVWSDPLGILVVHRRIENGVLHLPILPLTPVYWISPGIQISVPCSSLLGAWALLLPCLLGWQVQSGSTVLWQILPSWFSKGGGPGRIIVQYALFEPFESCLFKVTYSKEYLWQFHGEALGVGIEHDLTLE